MQQQQQREQPVYSRKVFIGGIPWDIEPSWLLFYYMQLKFNEERAGDCMHRINDYYNVMLYSLVASVVCAVWYVQN